MPTSLTLGEVRSICISKRGITGSSSWVMESFVKSGCQNSLPLSPSHLPGARESPESLPLKKHWWLGKAHTAKVGCRGKGSVSGEWGLGWRKKAGRGGGVFEGIPPHRTIKCARDGVPSVTSCTRGGRLWNGDGIGILAQMWRMTQAWKGKLNDSCPNPDSDWSNRLQYLAEPSVMTFNWES